MFSLPWLVSLLLCSYSLPTSGDDYDDDGGDDDDGGGDDDEEEDTITSD